MGNLPSQQEIEQAVLDSTNTLIDAFKSAPYAFLYESDLQAVLLTQIRSRLQVELKVPSSAPERPPYCLHLIYSEYNQRIDIACLDPEAASNVQPKPYNGFDT